jgi:hypothetical protein
MSPRMSFDDEEQRERAKRAVRSFHDSKLIETFRFHGLSIAEMDRAELLGLISFLATQGQYLRTVKIDDN